MSVTEYVSQSPNDGRLKSDQSQNCANSATKKHSAWPASKRSV